MKIGLKNAGAKNDSIVIYNYVGYLLPQKSKREDIKKLEITELNPLITELESLEFN